MALALAGATMAPPLVSAGPPSAPSVSKRAWLGVDLAKGPAGGVLVKHVINNSPAAKAGVIDNDQVVSVDGTNIDEPSQLVAAVALAGPSASVSLKVRRGGVEKTMSATLVPFPGHDQIIRLDKIGTFAPWKSVTTVLGSVPSNQAGLRGKVTIIDFWASWCGACKLMSPQLSKWHTSYASQGLQVVALTTDEKEVASNAAKAQSMKYAVASDDSNAASNAYSVKVLPTFFVVDKKGVIREVVTGYDATKNAEIEKLIKTLLAEPDPTASSAGSASPSSSSAPSTSSAPSSAPAVSAAPTSAPLAPPPSASPPK